MTIGALLAATFRFYSEQLRLVLYVSVPIVVFVNIVVAAGLGEFSTSYSKTVPVTYGYIPLAAELLVSSPLIVAMLARAIVIERGEGGRALDPRRVVTEGFDLFAVVFVPVVLSAAVELACFALGLEAGFVFFAIPLLYISVSWYFIVQAVVVDGARGAGALALSYQLVFGRWWQTALTGVCFAALVGIVEIVVDGAFGALALSANSYGPAIVGDIISEGLGLPFLAIGATFYYFELRVRGPLTARR